MQLDNRTDAGPSGGKNRPVWMTSIIFSLTVLAGYRVIEEREFLPVVALLGVTHVIVVVRFHDRFSSNLFLTHFLIVMATLASVFMHVYSVIGTVPQNSFSYLCSFAKSSTLNHSTYVFLGGYILLFCVVLFLLLWARRFLLTYKSQEGIESILVAAYAMSSVNIAFDYSLSRPLYHVGGDPDALAFFFVAGLFGVEYPLLLNLLLLTVSLTWCFFGSQRSH